MSTLLLYVVCLTVLHEYLAIVCGVSDSITCTPLLLQEIRVEFDVWSLGTPCHVANVSVYNGPSARPEDLLAVYCGDSIPLPVGTTRSSILIEFVSTAPGGNKIGFSARFKGRNVTGEWEFC